MKPGRPEIEVTGDDLRVIEKMAGLGSTLDDIALVLGWSTSTLDRKLNLPEVRQAYDRGRAIAKHEMSGRLWDIAMSTGEDGQPSRSAITACIFWLKSQAKWSDKHDEVESGDRSDVVIYLPDNGRCSAA